MISFKILLSIIVSIEISFRDLFNTIVAPRFILTHISPRYLE